MNTLLKIKLLIIFCFLFASSIFGQTSVGDILHTRGEIKNIIPEGDLVASPDVAAFQKVNLFDMNLYTGKAEISIPIFDIKLGDLTIPIKIDYNTGGVKVDDFASSVGLNWNLTAGGNIVRIVKDFPDNEVSYGLYAENDWDRGIVLNPTITGWGYNRKGAIPLTDELIWDKYNRYAVYSENMDDTPLPGYPLKDTHGIENDYSPDIFIANGPGISSKFICINNSSNEILPNNPNTFTTHFLDNVGYKMESVLVDKKTINGYGFYTPPSIYSHGKRSGKLIKDFSRFIIVNDNGFSYNFDQEELSESFLVPSNVDDPNGGGGIPEANARLDMSLNNYYKRIHTWNLKEITDKKSGASVIFDYQTYGNSYLVENTYVTRNSNAIIPPNPLPSDLCTFDFLSESSGQIYDKTGEERYWTKNPRKKRISEITFDQGYINFIYNNDRLDFPGEKTLDEIVIRNFNGKIISRYVFRYSYFNSKENCTQPECYRLKLVSLDKISEEGKVLSHKFEYEETRKLPRRGSLEQDYFGYYNNNGLVGVTPGNRSIYIPKLYFYQNGGTGAVLPFKKKNNSSYIEIPGSIDLTPNDYSLTGLLKKITYPTAGTLELGYENNSFKFENQEYVSGGARILNQTLADGGVVKKKMEYQYLESDGSTSGSVNNLPVFGYPTIFKANPFKAYSFIVYDKPKSNIELTNGSCVGYSKVIEREIGNGYTVYNFTSPKTVLDVEELRTPIQYNVRPGGPLDNYPCTESLIVNSAYPSIARVDNDYQRGKLILKETYDNSGNPLVKEQLNYLNRDLSKVDISKYFGVSKKEAYGILEMYRFKVDSKIKTAQYLNSSIEKTEIYNASVITSDVFQYHPFYPIVEKQTYSANGSTIITDKYYSFHPEVSSTGSVPKLLAQNRLRDLVKEKVYRDSNLLSTKEKVYSDFNGIVDTKNILTSKGVNINEAEDVIDLRDEMGMIQQYHDKSGKYTTIIWGYRHALPIAKIENATYEQISSYYFNLRDISNRGTEQDLITAQNALRNAMRNAMVTNYTHIPLVGVSSITDPKGISLFYNYDEFNRLSFVRDQNRNILERYCYNNKGQFTDCNPLYSNVAKQATFNRNCGSGVPTPIVYRVEAGKYTSAISQADVDAQADKDIKENGQIYANTYGTCTFASVFKSQRFTRDNCAPGGVPETYVYTVETGKYSSTISQEHADGQALDEIAKNGQAVTNSKVACLFFNTGRIANFTTDNCEKGKIGSVVSYNQVPGSIRSTISQADVDAKAAAQFDRDGQAYANANGNCFYLNSTRLTKVFRKNNCPVNSYSDDTYEHVIEANSVQSYWSQAEADYYAKERLEEGQTLANGKFGCKDIIFEKSRDEFKEGFHRLIVEIEASNANHSGRTFTITVAEYEPSRPVNYITEVHTLAPGQRVLEVHIPISKRANYAKVVSYL